MSGACGDLSSVSWHELRLSRFRISPFSCPEPCRDRKHPASLSLLINSLFFIVTRTLLSLRHCKDITFCYIAKFYGNIFAILTTINQKEPPRRMAHYTVLYFTIPYCTLPYYTRLHRTPLHFTPLFCCTLHFI